MRTIPRDSVPIGPARRRLLKFVTECGHSHRSAAAHIGIDRRIVNRILREEVAWIKRRTAARIMTAPVVKVQPYGGDHSSAASLVPALGTVRRLRALAVMGHPASRVAARTDLNVYTIRAIMRDAPESVTLVTRQAVTAAYEKMIHEPAVRGFSDHVRFLAQSRGWTGPMGWEDPDTDPEPVPEYTPLVDFVRANPGLGQGTLLNAMTADGMSAVDFRALLEQAIAAGAIRTWHAGHAVKLGPGREV